MTKNAFIKKYLKPKTKNMLFGILLSFLSIVFVMFLPQITQLFIDSVFSFSDTPTSSLGVLWLEFIALFGNLTTIQIVLVLSIGFVLCALLKNVCTFFATQNFFEVGSHACGEVRKDGFRKLGFLQNINQGKIFFNFTNDIDDLYDYYYKILPQAIALPMLIVLASGLCFLIDYKITLCFIGVLPLIVGIGLYFNKKSIENFKNSREKLSGMVTAGEEIVSKIREIKVFRNEDWAVEKYIGLSEGHHNMVKDANLFVNKSSLLLSLLRVAGIVVAIILSAASCFYGEMSIGYFVLMASYAFLIFNNAVKLVENNFDMGIANVGILRLYELVNQKVEDEARKNIRESKPNISFHDVEITLNGKMMFQNLNLNFEYGKHYAIKIPQGAGKTALARLLLGYVDASGGDILINGKNWKDYNAPSKRKMFSYISQEAFIFEGSIKENIVMFDEVQTKRLEKAVRAAQLQKLLALLPDKLDCFLFENGNNITAQDRQKINIARALYRNAPVLLIDNAFNKFKPDETAKLLAKIRKFYKGKTIIFLTNKKSETAIFENVISISQKTLKK